MRFTRTLALAIGLILVAGVVHAATIDLAKLERRNLKIRVGGKDVSFEADTKGNLNRTKPKLKNSQNKDVAEVTISGILDADPFIGYGVAATNFPSGALDFLFTFASPYVLGPYTVLDSSHSRSVTDGGGGAKHDWVVVSPIAQGTAIHQSSIDGVPITAANLGVLCIVNPPGRGGGSDACFARSFVSVPVWTAVDGKFDLLVKFRLLANDTYTGNGRIELKNAVPDASSTALLMLLGFATLVAARRWRQRAA